MKSIIFKKNRIKGKKKKRRLSLESSVRQPDWLLVGIVLFLTLFGLIMVANASAVEAYRDFADKLYYFRLQFRWVIFGFVSFLVASLFPYQKLQKLVPLFLFASFIGLILVILPRIGFLHFGARRWLNFGGINFQPSEIVKLAFIIYLAAYLVKKKNYLPLLLVSGLIVILMMFQPDLGTTVIILGSGFLVYFVSGAPIIQVIGLMIFGIIGGIILAISSPYRKARFLTFLNPLRDPLGASYHIRQILIALGSGNLFGLGLGQSRQKYEYLPAAATDSIFAVIAEELGFVGASFLVLVFALLIARGFRIAQRSPDMFGKLLASGITAWLGLQALVNLGAMVALVPLTGIPLPFISYGGSSLLLTLTAAGILVNISKYIR
ncbi:MAG TPA: putative lipid II flippase FtsW [Candidatus Bathyarchaeia archaeon]|nr:putative lipid II flippase FtsW [Candidatus Bathyarchaeia archaeon]